MRELPSRRGRWDSGSVRLSWVMSKLESPVWILIQGPEVNSMLNLDFWQTIANRNVQSFLETIFREAFGWWQSPCPSNAMLSIFFCFLQLYICHVYISGTLKWCEFDHQIRSLKIHYQIYVRKLISNWKFLIQWLLEEKIITKLLL